MLCHFLTVLSLQKKRDFWRTVSAWNLALGFLYVRKWRMVHFWRKNSNPISIFEYFRRFSWNKFAIFFSVLKEWHFNLQKVSLLMMNHWKNHWKQFWCLTMFITSGAKICQYVYCCLRWFWHGSHQSLLWTKRWAHPPIFFIVLFRIPCTKNVLSSTLLKRRKGGCCEKKTIACLDGGGASELSKVTFQTDPWSKEKFYNTLKKSNVVAKRTGNWGHQNCCAFSTFN